MGDSPGAQRRNVAVAKKNTAPNQRHHLDRRADRLADEGEKGASDELLTSRQLAHWLEITEQWVHVGRTCGYGPPFIEPFPKVIRYKRRDVVRWLRTRARLHASTVECA
jgi:hypothetical protein